MNKGSFLQIVDTLSMGGTERMSVNISGVLAERGWESHLVVSRKSGGLETFIPNGVTVHYLNKKTFYDVFAFWNLLKITRRVNPNIVHAHSTSVFWAVLLKMVLGKFVLVWHDHFGLSDQLRIYPRKEMILLSKWISKIVVVNHKLESFWKMTFSYRENDVQYIPNFPWLVLNPEGKFEKFTFLNLANFRPQKDQLNLLEAIYLLKSEGLNFRTLLVGEWVDPEWGTMVRKKAEELDLGDFVEFVGPVNDISAYLQKSHAGVLSSESEGLPVALLEYGLAALPVVTTNVGDCEKVICRENLGIIVPKSSPKELAEGMKKFLLDYHKSKELGENLKTFVEMEFGKEKFLQKYEELLGQKI
ncbi:glycosyltransferase involved in cell wall biosynthesis [Algoriphagus aquaeductus]|uniref:Glycosyltransferase involved in cell wall biosynthesis n=1 Tax=Algoriphagus aquaeductus TaxID=475299 RepID=A0A326RLU5_9BACT|nr:glycosyltransferase [Algoriphagus aquaeductus]PZV79130.1 glycosyltransferase involved in cell wall biosynthesis [Algoriphagus aquaeductus]